VDLPTDWSRPLRVFTAPTGRAIVCYEVHGDIGELPNEPPVDEYRLDRDVEGIKLYRRTEKLAERRAGMAWGWFERDHPALAAEVAAAPNAITVVGDLYEPPSLVYLRHAIGLVQMCLDRGGKAVHDVQSLRWYTADEWRAELFKDTMLPHEHVTIVTAEEGDRFWIRTRGMQKFGRPDVSLRRVPEVHRAAATSLANRLVALQARGETIPEGQPITGDPDGPVCRHEDGKDDPDFGAPFVEIVFP
jgi:hypothetical protein